MALAFGALTLLFSGCALFKKDTGPDAQFQGPPSFDLQVQSENKDLKKLLETQLDLQRYRHLPDLSESEISHLMEQAETDATQLLATQGYFNPTVRVARQNPAGSTRPQIVVNVEPGAATSVASVHLKFEGPLATSLGLPETIQRRVIRQFWQLRKGQRFSQTRWDGAKDRALRDLTAERYLAGNISSSQALIDADNNRADLQLSLDSGPVYHFGSAAITGNVNYDDETIRRFLRIPTGDDYSLSRLLQAQQRLVDTGFFDSVFLYMDPKADPAATPVQVQVSEAKLQKVVLGTGASTDYGPRISLEHTNNISPFFGWRSQIKTSFDQRASTQSLDLLSQPDASYWRWSLGAAHTREDDLGQITHSETLRAGRLQTNENIDRSIYAEYNRSRWLVVDPVSLSANYQTFSAYTANWAWTARHFDSLTFPTEGYGFGAEVGAGLAMGQSGISSATLPTRQPFARLLGRWQSYHPLDDYFAKDSNPGRIALRGQLGGIIAKPGAPVPANLLFLTGGDGSVRGYAYRSINAQDIVYNGVDYPQPGRYLVVGSVEWQRPIIIDGARSDWESAVFVDSGAVANTVQQLHMQTGVGVGARWRSPIGPFQADLAYGVQAKRFRIHVAVGFVF